MVAVMMMRTIMLRMMMILKVMILVAGILINSVCFSLFLCFICNSEKMSALII